MLTVVSSSGYLETLNRLLDAIARRDLTVFAQIDHAAAARAVEMELADELVVVFGNPRAGTPLMQKAPVDLAPQRGGCTTHAFSANECVAGGTEGDRFRPSGGVGMAGASSWGLKESFDRWTQPQRPMRRGD